MTPVAVITEFASKITEHITNQDVMIFKLKDFLNEVLLDESVVYDKDWREEAEKLVNAVEALPKADQNPGEGQILDRIEDMHMTKAEAEFGEEMSEADVAKMMGIKLAPKKEITDDQISRMSREELDDLEAAQDNATDIYKIAARVKNLARGSGMSLTPQGEMLANTYTHVMKAFYDFADTIPDKNLKAKLLTLIRSQEGMPANLIGAAGVGIEKPKKVLK